MQRIELQKNLAKVVFTFQKEGRCNRKERLKTMRKLFLPFKKKADATQPFMYGVVAPLFYLSKRRQMQRQSRIGTALTVVFTFRKEGRCN